MRERCRALVTVRAALGALGLALAVCGPLALTGRALAIGSPGTSEEFPVPAESTRARLWEIIRGAEGSMWFTESSGPLTQEDTLVRVAPTGLITGEFSVPTEKFVDDTDSIGLDGLALGANGDVWFTGHGEWGEDQSFIGMVTPAGKVSQFPIADGRREGRYPGAIALGSDGNMWFAYGESDVELPGPISGAIGRITPAGLISRYAIPGNAIVEGIARGADGNMWFVAYGVNGLRRSGSSYIGRITPAGVVTEFPISTSEGYPYELALGAGGDMWFTEPRVNKIGRITPEGAISEFAVPSVGGPIVLGSDGNMWFTESYGTNALGRITPTGVVSSFAPVATHGELNWIASGPDGNIWFTENGANREGAKYLAHIGRFIVPLAPVNNGLPVLSGTAVAGQVLSASEGAWLNDPSAFGYQWQACDASGGGCVDLGGEVAATHVLTAGDVGHTLRVVVSATGVGGSASAVSSPSGVVQPAPPVPPPAKPAVVKVPLPVVGATVTWSFGWSRARMVVESLMVHGLPAGGVVEVECAGRGCGFARHRWATAARDRSCRGRKCTFRRPVVLRGSANLAGLFKGRRLAVGTRITVNITEAGWVGKSFVFAAAHVNRSPRVEITCLAPAPSKAAGEC